MQNIRFVAAKAREVSQRLGLLSTEAKNEILFKIADAIEENSPAILKANAKDISAGKRNSLSEGLLDRLLLTKDRILAIAADVRKVAGLEDFVGKIIESRQLKNELYLKRVRVPLGVVGIIYESRPNVTVDAATLCLKSGNAVILKGGSDAINSNRALVKIIQNVLKEVSFLEPPARLQDAVQLVDTADRNVLKELLTLRDFIDVVIPRGGRNLINFVVENSRIPIIETGASVVHTYVHADAEIKKAVKIILNAKLRRVSICNTTDCLLIHQSIAAPLLKEFVAELSKNPYCASHLELRADKKSFDILRKLSAPQNFKLTIKKAQEKDYSTEFLDYILAVKTVKSLDEAIDHISIHSLKHSEAIITEDEAAAQKFLKTVDAACVYWNASTQFSDGGQFGLGAEIGISTQKLHVRGPFALEGLTSYKWVVQGSGQIRT
ncbi:MAG: glutamate-5-semialdehyde dehydrogenase [Candidatus Gracilibacteria bacterium]